MTKTAQAHEMFITSIIGNPIRHMTFIKRCFS